MSMLGFFRKRQKLIFVIMVLLMVSFLVGWQGLSMIMGGGGGDTTIAQTRAGEFSAVELRNAQGDIELLSQFMRGFEGRSLDQAIWLQMNMQAEDEADLTITYALLLKEAQAANLRVTEPEVDRTIQQLRDNPAFSYDALVTSLRQNRRVTDEQIRDVLARWGMVLKSYQASALTTPPSQSELLHLFRDTNEQLKLKLVKLTPEAFLDAVGEPTEEQLQAMFDEYKGKMAGEFQGVDTFSFGYLRPARVSLVWLHLSQEAVRRAAMPSQREIQAWIDTHEDELVKEVPVETEAAAADAGDDDDEGEPVKPQVLQTVPMTPAEQQAEAIRQLKPAIAQDAFAELNARVSRRLLTWKAPEGRKSEPGQAYFDVAKSFQLPGDDLLNREILLLLQNEPTELQDVIQAIAAQAEPPLATICYPWNLPGPVTIDPAVKIKPFQVRNTTVGETLAKVRGELEGVPELTWGLCDGFDDVLFCTEDLRLFPVTAGQVGLSTRKTLEENELLAAAHVQGQRRGMVSLLDMAFNARPINVGGTVTPGEDGPPMQVWDEGNAGVIFWRLLDASQPSIPTDITDEIRTQLVNDWKHREAFKLAQTKAAEITTAEALENFVAENNLEPIETEMLTRKRMGMAPGGMMQLAFVPTQVQALDFSASVIDMHFLNEAFKATTPEDPNGEYAQVAEAVASVALPSEGYVVLMQRIDYRPALESSYQASKEMLMQQLERNAGMAALRQWVNPDAVKMRLDFQSTQ